ncbi:HNH endonuclease signature motif containing protein [Streptomyces sp. WI04-05B]|uniref:HNH endonuclease signature motif containing protein n=1 Tax=Streptomyces TaxID=1883 RepID=UPI0029A5BAD5|nr:MULTISPECIES: HNH endonuclease signature motif containing protein [unclassified Streptomyces]MDX2543725.1 HNH endonuclease signature motif containing protein [Streptomyces sp. WI04-05B]MDX2582185.1 HNH endonuclease signature motif containing protein [Streptomyces sp. WI04-05A]MDX3747587.1 HNH endonuclease signature motif containing protein [Streptomyces sp. AK08-02]
MTVRYTRELLEEAALRTQHIDDAVRWCGGNPTPGSRHYLRQKMAEAEIDISHFTTGRVRHTEERLRAAVAESTSIKDVVRRLGINQVGGNQTHISRRIAKFGIDTSHFGPVRRQRPKGSLGSPLCLRSAEEGRVPGRRLRRALLHTGVEERCTMCGTGPERNGRPLSLEVDHINGDWWDNRPENLQLLCPNCHAVTDTYRGRKRRNQG